MENGHLKDAKPIIVKVVQPEQTGIQVRNHTRHSIGYVLRGRKYIYYGDTRYAIQPGDIFYLGQGTHYIENLPEEGQHFEEIDFHYNSEQLARILNHLSMNYQLNIERDHTCPACESQEHVATPSCGILKNFFNSVNQSLREGMFNDNPIAENLKLTELIFLVLGKSDSCVKKKILEDTDLVKENFEHIVMQHVFHDILIDDLAAKCNRSLTSFKKEFRKHFHEPPHKWFIRQRLMHARLLLISTQKAVAEIGRECTFPNTSHFIKLFKKEYGFTPAQYRSRHDKGLLPVQESGAATAPRRKTAAAKRA